MAEAMQELQVCQTNEGFFLVLLLCCRSFSAHHDPCAVAESVMCQGVLVFFYTLNQWAG